MRWRNTKSWEKGLIIGLIPLILCIITTLFFFVMVSKDVFLVILVLYLPIFYIFSFIFLFFSFLIGLIAPKSWKVKISVILVIILVITSVIIYGFSGSPPSGEIETYKGIWGVVYFVNIKTLLFNVQQLKEDGVNTISFGPFYNTDNKGNIHKIPFMKQITILLIQAAHRNGFRVFLIPDMWGPGFTGIKNNEYESFLEQATDISLEWAEIAEKYGVEMYAPSNEPAIIVENDKGALDRWAHDVALKIKERYSGILVYKASSAEWGFDNDYKGYDYVGLDIFPHDQTLEEFKSELKQNIEDGLRFAERDNCKGVILSEIGVQIKVDVEGDVTSTTDEAFSLDYQKQAYEMFFEEGEKNNVFGYIFCCWGEGQFGPDNLPAEQVMKEWFHKIK